jgi:hypothetical protein
MRIKSAEVRSDILAIVSLPEMRDGPWPLIAHLQRELSNPLIRQEIHSSPEVRKRTASERCDIGFAAELIDTHGRQGLPRAEPPPVLGPNSNVPGQVKA